MAFTFKLPDIGEGVAEAEIVKWLVAVGDTVAEDQPLVEVLTDKATVEIPSPRAGRVASLGGAEGATIKVGSVLLEIEVVRGSTLVFRSRNSEAAQAENEKALCILAEARIHQPWRCLESVCGACCGWCASAFCLRQSGTFPFMVRCFRAARETAHKRNRSTIFDRYRLLVGQVWLVGLEEVQLARATAPGCGSEPRACHRSC